MTNLQSPYGGRSIPEWIGSHPDAAIPQAVRLRVFERHGGICHISGRKITPADKWECDHVRALADGGEHREANLAPAILDKHREKTSHENSERAKADSIRAKHIGAKPRRGRPMPGTRASGIRKRMNGSVERWT